MTNLAKRLIQQQEVRAEFPYLIKVSIDGYDDELYCNSDEDIMYEDNIYKSAVFKINPPEYTTTSVGNASIEMSCIDQEWIARIRSVETRAKIQFIGAITYNDVSEKVIEPIFDNSFTLTKVTWDELSIKWDMVFDDKWDILIPCIICDSLNCNGVA